MLFLFFMLRFFFLLFSLACTSALHRQKVEKGEWCVPGCQEVRCALAALVAVLVCLLTNVLYTNEAIVFFDFLSLWFV